MTKDFGIRLNRPWPTFLKAYRQTAKCLVLGKLSVMVPGMVDDTVFKNLKYFCCFVGHGRSGGTLVGALLNAHPNVVMSNELNALRQLRSGLSDIELFRAIYFISRRQARRGSKGGGGYSYHVPGQWQGRHEKIFVIGDRKAGGTAFEIASDPYLLDTLETKVRLGKKFVHVARNPFDNIATTFRKTLPKAGEAPHHHLKREINNYFGRCEAIKLVQARFGITSICYVRHEMLSQRPAEQLRRLCQFLEVPCSEDYLAGCAAIVRTSPNMTRFSVDWPSDLKQTVTERIKFYPWLEGYSFQC